MGDTGTDQWPLPCQ